METKNTIAMNHFIILLIGISLLLWSLLVSDIPTRFSYGFFWSMMVLFGVMHGVGDIDEIQTLHPTKSKTTLVGIYTLLMIITAVWWYLAPALTTVLFVGVAAYHFGNEHRDGYENHSKLQWVHNTLRWACVLIPLIGFQRAYSSTLLAPVVWVVEIPSSIILGVYAVTMLVRIILHGYTYSQLIWYKAIATEIALVVIIWLLAYFTNFYISFWFYFGIAHGLPQIITLYKSSYTSIHVQYLTLVTSYPDIILWTLVLWIVRYYIARLRFPDAQLMMVFLMFLGILTIPHVLMELSAQQTHRWSS